MDEKCYSCGTNKNVVKMTSPFDATEKIHICENCIYYKCKSCSRECTINDIGVVKCFCGDRDVCYSCLEKGIYPEKVGCPNCSKALERAVCNNPKCKEKAIEYFNDCLEPCSFCITRKRCIHSILSETEDEDPYLYRTSVFCCYENCRKWICPSCVKESFRPTGFYCIDHHHL
jgi:hypothetical protein